MAGSTQRAPLQHWLAYLTRHRWALHDHSKRGNAHENISANIYLSGKMVVTSRREEPQDSDVDGTQ